MNVLLRRGLLVFGLALASIVLMLPEVRGVWEWFPAMSLIGFFIACMFVAVPRTTELHLQLARLFGLMVDISYIYLLYTVYVTSSLNIAIATAVLGLALSLIQTCTEKPKPQLVVGASMVRVGLPFPLVPALELPSNIGVVIAVATLVLELILTVVLSLFPIMRKRLGVKISKYITHMLIGAFGTMSATLLYSAAFVLSLMSADVVYVVIPLGVILPGLAILVRYRRTWL